MIQHIVGYLFCYTECLQFVLLLNDYIVVAL